MSLYKYYSNDHCFLKSFYSTFSYELHTEFAYWKADTNIISYPNGIYLFKVNNGNSRLSKIYSKSIIKTPE